LVNCLGLIQAAARADEDMGGSPVLRKNHRAISSEAIARSRTKASGEGVL
jgi:hypothetical protein